MDDQLATDDPASRLIKSGRVAQSKKGLSARERKRLSARERKATIGQRAKSDYWPGSDRGSPNHRSALFSKRARAQIWSPARFSTIRPTPWRMPVGARK